MLTIDDPFTGEPLPARLTGGHLTDRCTCALPSAVEVTISDHMMGQHAWPNIRILPMVRGHLVDEGVKPAGPLFARDVLAKVSGDISRR